MGNWKIRIAGNGPHHNGNDVDANELARRITEALAGSGHTVVASNFLYDPGKTENLLADAPNLIRDKNGNLIELAEGQTVVISKEAKKLIDSVESGASEEYLSLSDEEAADAEMSQANADADKELDPPERFTSPEDAK